MFVDGNNWQTIDRDCGIVGVFQVFATLCMG